MKQVFTLLFLLSFFISKAQKQLVLRMDASGFYITHTVLASETFLKLGSLYNVSPVKLSAYNSLSLSHDLALGDALKVPISAQNFEQKGQKGIYEVLVPLKHAAANNETLNDVSKKYNNVPLQLLKDWNPGLNSEVLEGNNIIVGHLRVKKELAKYFGSDAPVIVEVRKTEAPLVVKAEPPVGAKAEPLAIKKTEATTIKKTEAAASKRLEAPRVIKKAETRVIVETEPITNATTINTDYDSDKLFEMARAAAFDNKNYPLAIIYSKSALAKSPGYTDIRVFLSRIYTWSDMVDSAREQLSYVIENDADYTDAYVALADLEYWNDQPVVALAIVNKGLQHNKASKELLTRKVKILSNLNRSKEAGVMLDSLLKMDPKNTEIRALSSKLRETINGNRLGVSYDYTYFDKQFKDPWHMGSIEYSRQTPIGSASIRLNYANRFKSNGLQYELDGYPNISRNLYSYVSFAYSNDVGVFPRYRGGFSLYSSLPRSFEGEVGFRYLKFSEDPTWIYTIAAGKYHKNWLFNARTYLTPGTANISHSYNLGARYYYGGAFDFLGLVLGTGISPDERPVALLLNSNYRLISQKASATFKREIKSKHIITVNASWNNIEYLPKTKGNQIEGGIAYQIRM